MPKKVLIIEDDEFFRDLLHKKFSAEGIETQEAINGDDGMKKIAEEKPALILLDLLLPDVDGFKILEGVKANPETAGIPVIILSNLGQQEDIDRGMKLGADDFLVKSQFDMDSVLTRIRKALD